MYRYLFIAVLFASALTLAADAQDGPKDAAVLIIRHAEDGGTGRDLAPRGHERAEAKKIPVKRRLCINVMIQTRAGNVNMRVGDKQT